MRRCKFIALSLALIFLAASTGKAPVAEFPSLAGRYLGQTLPGLSPLMFAPGIVSTERNELNSVFTPDGKEFYFTIISKIKEHLLPDPGAVAKPLKGVFKGLYRFRVGAYRIIFAVDHAEHRVIVLHVKHRFALDVITL